MATGLFFESLSVRQRLVAIVSATGFAGAASGTIGAARSDFGVDGKAALVGTIVDKIDYDTAQGFELFNQIGMHLDFNIIRSIFAESVIRLIQSQPQYGTASAIPHEVDKERLAFGLLGFKNLADLQAGNF